MRTADGGPRFAATVKFTGRSVRLPDVVFWSPAPYLERRGNHARMRFRSPPARVGDWQTAQATVSDGAGKALLHLYDVSSGDELDLRLVEDHAKRFRVSLAVRTALGTGYYSAPVAMTGGPRAPSRGRPCFEYGRSGRPIEQSPCGLTDGNLGKDWTPKVADYQCADDTPCDRRVMVDLGAARRLTFLVAHGCQPFFDTVEVSADGTSWTEVVGRDSPEEPMDDGCWADLDGTVARYVRLKGPAGGFYLTRREISVFY